jgi:hypothetical protein
MSTGFAISPITKAWRELYKAVLFEHDKSKLSERIAHAEWALVLRARELFHTGGEHLQERQAVDAAMCTLQMLRSTTISVEERKSGRRKNHRAAHAGVEPGSSQTELQSIDLQND